jgi:hypothetical protein
LTHPLPLLHAHTHPLQAFKAAQVAKVLTGLTKVRHYDVELCASLADAAERDMGAATGEQVAQMMWALAHQRYEQPGVFEAAALQVGGWVWSLRAGVEFCVSLCIW